MTCNHEWGGAVIPGPVNRIVIDQCENCGELRLPDAAPPAQAVDLGRWSQRHAEDLKQAIHTALSAHAGSLSQKKRDAISDYVKRLLIDSQAVGNG